MSVIARYILNAAGVAYRKLVIATAGTIASLAASPTVTSGSGAPSASEPKGSLYLRTNGTGGSQVLYVATDSAGTWVALSNTADAAQVQAAGGQSYVVDVEAAATGEANVKLADNLASAWEFKEAANSYLKFVTTNGSEGVTAGKALTQSAPGKYTTTAQALTDPGNAGAIPVTADGVCPLVSAGAETRTLAAPSYNGQDLILCMDTDGGDITLTCATLLNQAGNNTAVFKNAGEYLALRAIKIGANYRWRVVASDMATALSTV